MALSTIKVLIVLCIQLITKPHHYCSFSVRVRLDQTLCLLESKEEDLLKCCVYCDAKLMQAGCIQPVCCRLLHDISRIEYLLYKLDCPFAIVYADSIFHTSRYIMTCTVYIYMGMYVLKIFIFFHTLSTNIKLDINRQTDRHTHKHIYIYLYLYIEIYIDRLLDIDLGAYSEHHETPTHISCVPLSFPARCSSPWPKPLRVNCFSD